MTFLRFIWYSIHIQSIIWHHVDDDALACADNACGIDDRLSGDAEKMAGNGHERGGPAPALDDVDVHSPA